VPLDIFLFKDRLISAVSNLGSAIFNKRKLIMKCKTLIIAAATFIITTASSQQAVAASTQQVQGQTFYEVLCHDANTHRLISRYIWDSYDEAQIDLSTCEFMGGVGSLSIGRR
tara:strand:- start:3417 stop:3755 length:339 start_codon:yes stop_codon:yes gene_type:complete